MRAAREQQRRDPRADEAAADEAEQRHHPDDEATREPLQRHQRHEREDHEVGDGHLDAEVRVWRGGRPGLPRQRGITRA